MFAGNVIFNVFYVMHITSIVFPLDFFLNSCCLFVIICFVIKEKGCPVFFPLLFDDGMIQSIMRNFIFTCSDLLVWPPILVHPEPSRD